MSIITPILDSIITLVREEEYLNKKKTSFWASESETMAFEIYHRWMATEPTNPITGEKLIMLSMRKLTEVAIVDLMRKAGILVENLSNDERCYFEWGPNKVPISGYPDAVISHNKEKIVVEIKTYYGGKQHSEIRIGIVKTNYLKQLAIYMYHLKISHGILLMVNQGTGEKFEYELYRKEDNPYYFICTDNDIEINLEETFKRFEKIYVENILTQKEPAIEYQYKYDINKINWDEISSDKISKARANKAVIGDFQIKYSDFKDLIIERQNTTPGYTDEELKTIRQLTDGYSIKKANKVKFNPNDL
jgi:hypothetical protein